MHGFKQNAGPRKPEQKTAYIGDGIYMKFRSRQNQSVLLRMKTVTPMGGGEQKGLTGRGHQEIFRGDVLS